MGAGSSSGAEADASFDRYARMVRRALGVPVALVSLVEADRQVFPGAVGLPAAYQASRETPLSHSFCQHVVADSAPLVVADARLDDRVSDNLAIPDLGVVAYAGWPITDHTGTVVGSLCAIDDRPHPWSQDELDALADLAAACSSELVQRGLRELSAAREREAQDLGHRSRVLLALSERLAETDSLLDVARAVQRVALEQLGCQRAGIWLRRAAAAVPTAGRSAGRETVTYVDPHDASPWESARRHADLPVDRSNPLGEAILDGGPLFYPSVTVQNSRWPHLATEVQLGEARLFLPLRVRGGVLGALVLIWEEVRMLTPGDLATFQAMASYAAQAVVRGRLFEERREALVILQDALLPRLPDPDGLELAARYRPAAERQRVGGDWYDAVVMPSGATALMVGDVVGHDIRAAAVMGELRTTLRAIAWAVDDAPSANVSRLDRAVGDLDVGALATLVYARLERDDAGHPLLRWTNAGHPPPLLVESDGSVRWLTAPASDLLIGVAPDQPRGDHRAPVPPGATVLLYTDGLVERRGEHLQVGLDRLAASVSRHHRLGVGELLDAVLRDLAGEADDDVAVLAARVVD